MVKVLSIPLNERRTGEREECSYYNREGGDVGKVFGFLLPR